MGGYNTLAEAVSKGVPVVCVPRKAPRAEQLIRANALEQLGLVQTLGTENLSAAALRTAVGAALTTPRQELFARAKRSLGFEGAERAAGHLLELAGSRRNVKERAISVTT
jgi:predicted glycosyltransferase